MALLPIGSAMTNHVILAGIVAEIVIVGRR